MGTVQRWKALPWHRFATLNKVPFVIIRAISDKADNSAPVAYETFEEQAIVHTVKLLAAMFLKMSK